MISTVGACTCNYLFAFTRNSPTIATSNTSAAKRGHNSPLRSVNVGTLRSICQRAVTRREKSTSSEMISTVGACTCNYLFAFKFAFNPAILSISCTTLRTAYFFLPGSDGESKSQPGVLETSNSGASALGAAGFGFAAAAGAAAVFVGVLEAPAAAAIAAGFANAGASLAATGLEAAAM